MKRSDLTSPNDTLYRTIMSLQQDPNFTVATRINLHGTYFTGGRMRVKNIDGSFLRCEYIEGLIDEELLGLFYPPDLSIGEEVLLLADELVSPTPLELLAKSIDD